MLVLTIRKKITVSGEPDFLFKLKVGDKTQEIFVHSEILEKKSFVFKNLIEDTNEKSFEMVFSTELKCQIFVFLIYLIYEEGQVDLRNQPLFQDWDNVFELFHLHEFYHMTLIRKITEFPLDKTNMEKVINLCINTSINTSIIRDFSVHMFQYLTVIEAVKLQEKLNSYIPNITNLYFLHQVNNQLPFKKLIINPPKVDFLINKLVAYDKRIVDIKQYVENKSLFFCYLHHLLWFIHKSRAAAKIVIKTSEKLLFKEFMVVEYEQRLPTIGDLVYIDGFTGKETKEKKERLTNFITNMTLSTLRDDDVINGYLMSLWEKTPKHEWIKVGTNIL